MTGPENVRHTLNQSDAKLKTIVIWSLRFPRFEQFACFYVEFLLANDNINLYSDRSSGLCWFWFHEICSVRNPQFAFARMKSNRGKFVSNDINLKLEHPKKQILAICYESSFFFPWSRGLIWTQVDHLKTVSSSLFLMWLQKAVMLLSSWSFQFYRANLRHTAITN